MIFTCSLKPNPQCSCKDAETQKKLADAEFEERNSY
jgi:hypothetical protein